jgi:hypothetical protein
MCGMFQSCDGLFVGHAYAFAWAASMQSKQAGKQGAGTGRSLVHVKSWSSTVQHNAVLVGTR